MIRHLMEQRTDEWLRLKWGKLGSSDAASLCATKKRDGAPTAAHLALRDRLVCEWLTPYAPNEQFVSKDMQHGIEFESEAIAQYEMLTDCLVQPGGIIEHDVLRAVASPDGIVGELAGLIEVKVPKPQTHINYLREGIVPAEYVPQVLHQMVISGVPYVDFVSYGPEFPPHLRLFVARYAPPVEALKSYELLLRMFLGDVEREVDRLLALGQVVA